MMTSFVSSTTGKKKHRDFGYKNFWFGKELSWEMFNKQLDLEIVAPLTGHDVRRQQDTVDYALSLGGGTSSARPG